MYEVAKFKKISYRQWLRDCMEAVEPGESEFAYEYIKLPERATLGSAGYDFFLPYNITIQPGESVMIPTGIKCNIDPGYVLMLFPRSSLGYKYKLHLANTVGIIDSDFYNNKANEGHISVKLINGGNLPVAFKQGARYCQGIFVPYGITYDDRATGVRRGGTGSTGI